MVATVTYREIHLPDEERVLNVFTGQGWNVLVYVEKLLAGMKLVFTNLLNNQVSMMPFGETGMELRHDWVERMPLNGSKPFIRVRPEKGELKYNCHTLNYNSLLKNICNDETDGSVVMLFMQKFGIKEWSTCVNGNGTPSTKMRRILFTLQFWHT